MHDPAGLGWGSDSRPETPEAPRRLKTPSGAASGRLGSQARPVSQDLSPLPVFFLSLQASSSSNTYETSSPDQSPLPVGGAREVLGAALSSAAEASRWTSVSLQMPWPRGILMASKWYRRHVVGRWKLR